MEFFSSEIIFTFITLSFLEIILGIDNLVFIALVVSNLPSKFRDKARYIGIGLALGIRVLMLMTLSWVMTSTTPLFAVFGLDFSFKNLLLVFGGIFLIYKSGVEIYSDIRHVKKDGDVVKLVVKQSFVGAIIQITAVDFVFSFDSIITAIGITTNIPVIVAAVVVSMLVMLFASDKVSRIIQKHPSVKIVALAFIFMIGVILLADGLHFEISKGYLYFALFFTIAVECLNIVAGARPSKN